MCEPRSQNSLNIVGLCIGYQAFLLLAESESVQYFDTIVYFPVCSQVNEYFAVASALRTYVRKRIQDVNNQLFDIVPIFEGLL